MKVYSEQFKEDCQKLRSLGTSLNDIVKIKKAPKTTIFEWIRNIKLSPEAQEKIWKNYIAKVSEAAKTKENFGFKRRKIVKKPYYWSKELINIAAHFLFDGQILKSGCIYSNRNKSQINYLKKLMKKYFNLEPYARVKKNGVNEIGYYYVDLGEYMKRKAMDLLKFITSASQEEKRIFLKAFFDDEGCVHIWKNARKIRGYQHNFEILKLVQKLLKDFDIESKIDEKYKEIVISRKPNLIKFRNKINFSKGVKVNGKRKNSTWEQDLEKRKILEKIIASYKPIGTPGVHY